MSKGWKAVLIVVGGLVAATLIFGVGVAAGRASWWIAGASPLWEPWWGPGGWMTEMMGPGGDGYGWMDRRGGMMGGGGGMMGGFGGWPAGPGGLQADPLTLEQAGTAVEGYLERIGDEDLRLGEIMIFDNHGYAQIVEASTGLGAMEVLIDPLTLSVYPEHGPNMMWNLKYGHMAGSGMMGGYGGGMMGGPGRGLTPGRPAAGADPWEMPISAEEAVAAAQVYLDRYLAGYQADDHADRYYGYYTLHIERDGAVAGMLSVNGYSGQVFLHSWHGDFVEMTEGHAD